MFSGLGFFCLKVQTFSKTEKDDRAPASLSYQTSMCCNTECSPMVSSQLGYIIGENTVEKYSGLTVAFKVFFLPSLD